MEEDKTRNMRAYRSKDQADEPPNRPVVRWLWWFVGGGALSFFALCSITLFVLVLVSVGLNAYLTWQLSGLELVVVRPMETTAEANRLAPVEALVVVVTATPANVAPNTPAAVALAVEPTPVAPTNTPVPILAAPTSTPEPQVRIVTATPSPTITQLELSQSLPPSNGNSGAEPPPAAINPAEQVASVKPVDSSSGAPTEGILAASGSTQFAAATSNNQYILIPLEDGRDPRPAAEHGDLNISLRQPQPSQAEAKLIDYTGTDDSNAPKLSAIFQPNFNRAYTVHDWDWGCNCQGKLKSDGFLIGIKTTPGTPIYIPTKEKDIWKGEYYAVVLYASENSLTFVYSREGTVAHAYAVHYLGLNVDPNLLRLYRESSGNELPGLRLDTPVGTANEELIVSIRDKGSFMDTRSRKDWWD